MLSSRKRDYLPDLLHKGGRTSSTRKRRRRYDDDDSRKRAHQRRTVNNVCLRSAAGGKSAVNLSETSFRTSLDRQLQSPPHIPEDLLFSKVLILLPPQKWFQLRCVCRSWNALLPGRLLGSKVLAADQLPWQVFVRFFGSDFESCDVSARKLLIYIPFAASWLPFPLPFPISQQPTYSNSVADLDLSNTPKYNISSLLGPGLQNTHPFYRQYEYGHWYPLMASAGGLICTLIYNKDVVEADKLPIPLPVTAFNTFSERGFKGFNISEFYNKMSDSNWASLLLFNPLTGKALVEPLLPDPVMVRVGLSLSIVQVYDCSSDATKDRNCQYYVVLCPVSYARGDVDARAGLWIYDVKRRSWKENIASAGISTCKRGAEIYFRTDQSFDISTFLTADGTVFDILRDADILTYQVNIGLMNIVMPQEEGMSWLFGYSIEKNVWMVTKLAEPRSYRMKLDEFVVWKDSASCRIFLAASFRSSSNGRARAYTGFDVWELKPMHMVHAHAYPQIRYYWRHLSTTPSRMWTRPPFLFITAGSTVCLRSADFSSDGPPRHYSHPVMYDAVSDTWSQLPHTPLPSPHTGQYFGEVPLLALQPSVDDKML